MKVKDIINLCKYIEREQLYLPQKRGLLYSCLQHYSVKNNITYQDLRNFINIKNIEYNSIKNFIIELENLNPEEDYIPILYSSTGELVANFKTKLVLQKEFFGEIKHPAIILGTKYIDFELHLLIVNFTSTNYNMDKLLINIEVNQEIPNFIIEDLLIRKDLRLLNKIALIKKNELGENIYIRSKNTWFCGQHGTLSLLELSNNKYALPILVSVKLEDFYKYYILMDDIQKLLINLNIAEEVSEKFKLLGKQNNNQIEILQLLDNNNYKFLQVDSNTVDWVKNFNVYGYNYKNFKETSYLEYFLRDTTGVDRDKQFTYMVYYYFRLKHIKDNIQPYKNNILNHDSNIDNSIE